MDEILVGLSGSADLGEVVLGLVLLVVLDIVKILVDGGDVDLRVLQELQQGCQLVLVDTLVEFLSLTQHVLDLVDTGVELVLQAINYVFKVFSRSFEHLIDLLDISCGHFTLHLGSLCGSSNGGCICVSSGDCGQGK